MAKVNLEIQKAFLDGINEIFEIMFTPHLKIFLLNLDETDVDDIYGETTEKKYNDPIEIVGRVQNDLEQEKTAQGTVRFNALITVPTKQLILNKIPHETEEDLEVLRKAKFQYKGVEYLVVDLDNTTLVADKFHFLKFQCLVDEKSSLK